MRISSSELKIDLIDCWVDIFSNNVIVEIYLYCFEN